MAVPKLVLATGNPGKLRELRELLAQAGWEVLGPGDLGLEGLVVDETGASLEANALLKARAFAAAAGLPALADDSGLEVEALGGAPGVHSARWVPGSDADRMAALLTRLTDCPPGGRGAAFRAVLALVWPDGRALLAEGRVCGRIAPAPRGAGGFGYDPIFLVEDGGLDGQRTMAELLPQEKAALSHRARAMQGLLDRLKETGLARAAPGINRPPASPDAAGPPGPAPGRQTPPART